MFVGAGNAIGTPHGRVGGCTAQEKHLASEGCSRIVVYGPQVPGLTRSVTSHNRDILACTIETALFSRKMTMLTSWHTRSGILREISRLGLSSGAVLSTATAISSTLVFASTSAKTADNSVDSNTFTKEMFTGVSLQMRGDVSVTNGEVRSWRRTSQAKNRMCQTKSEPKSSSNQRQTCRNAINTRLMWK